MSARCLFLRTTGGVLVLVGASQAAFSQEQAAPREFTYSISAGANYSDNIGRTNIDEQSDTSADVGLRGNVAREQGHLRAQGSADLTYRTYLQNTYGDQFVGGVTATTSYWFRPERFSWVLEENFAQTFLDPTAVETPANRQNTNYVTTGPQLYVPLSDRMQLLVGARWSDASYEQTDTDNQRWSGNIGVNRRMGAHSSLGLQGETEHVEFQNSTLNPNFNRNSGFFTYTAQGARTTLSVRTGYTALDAPGDHSGGPLVTITVDRRVGARSSLGLDIGTNMTDSAEALRRDQTIGGVRQGNEDSVVSGDPFQSDYASISWGLDGSRTSLTLGSDWRHDDHERVSALDRSSYSARVGLSRRISPLFSAGLNGYWTHEDYDNVDISFREWSAGFSLSWNIGRSVSLGLRGDHYAGSGDTSAGTGTRDYTENRASLVVTFTPTR